MTVPDGTTKHIRIADDMAQQLQIAGAEAGILGPLVPSLTAKKALMGLNVALRLLDDSRLDLLSDDLYEKEATR